MHFFSPRNTFGYCLQFISQTLFYISDRWKNLKQMVSLMNVGIKKLMTAKMTKNEEKPNDTDNKLKFQEVKKDTTKN